MQWGIWFRAFHDFCGNFEGSCDFIADLVHGVKSFFYCGDSGGEVYCGYELQLVSIPYLERGVSHSAVCPSVVSEFHEGDQVSPVVHLVVTKYSKILLEFLVDPFSFSICLRVESCGHG